MVTYRTLTLENKGNLPINHSSPKWYDYQTILEDVGCAVADFPEHSQFEIHFQTLTQASFYLGDRHLTYTNQNGSQSVIILDNVYRQIHNGEFLWLSGDIETFLSLEPGINKLKFIGAYNVRVLFRPMYI